MNLRGTADEHTGVNVHTGKKIPRKGRENLQNFIFQAMPIR